MTTTANVRPSESSHWYHKSGEPCYEVPKADGKGMTPTTLRHARKLNLLPSVTTILRILDKPALTAWKIEQAVLAVLTTPRINGEPDDVFAKRVLSIDKEQDKERDAAAQLGTDIHSAIEGVLSGAVECPVHLATYVAPVIAKVQTIGPVLSTERILVGARYAGKCDCITGTPSDVAVIDFKSTKNPPKECYPEHKLQLAAYTDIYGANKAFNIYISTTQPGVVTVCEVDDLPACSAAFQQLVAVWQWMNSYCP